MAEKELYDYFFGTVTPDYTTTTLTLTPTGKPKISGNRNQIIHKKADGSRNTITMGSTPIVRAQFTVKGNASDMGTIFDFYWDSAKANCRGRSFKFACWDGHTYTAMFDMDLPLTYDGTRQYLDIVLIFLGIAP